MKCLAIIPARGGSLRIPRKNIKAFCGQPIIAYSIAAALRSGCFSEIMVSTEDDEIAAVAAHCGAKIPFKRSFRTADNYATLVDVVEEVVRDYRKIDIYFDYVCCILATAPFITTGMVQQSYEILINRSADAVISVVRFDYPIQRGLKLEDGFIRMMWPENYEKRSQDLESVYHDAGLFYWLRTESLLRQKRFYMERSIPFELSHANVHDIDTLEDWQIAEFKYMFFHNANKLKQANDGAAYK
ncbi:MAG: pseudaminic acid cytidylyltransferase [Candidatus Babeliales bacterium]|jgi:N-acylneuraminate cytidylyltransferase